MTEKTKTQKSKKKTTSTEEVVLTKEDFFKALDKAIQPVSPKKKQPAKGKRKTSE